MAATYSALKPWQHRQWCVPEALSGEYVAAMEDVLVLYEMPYDARYPTVCRDEKPVVLHAEVRESRPPVPGPEGHPERRDYRDVRPCAPNLFLTGQPPARSSPVSLAH